MGNDSVYGSLFFFLTGLHFFHLLVGLFLLSLFFWGSSFSTKKTRFLMKRITEVHLFYNLQLFYWHFIEILWLFIFLVLYFNYNLLISICYFLISESNQESIRLFVLILLNVIEI